MKAVVFTFLIFLKYRCHCLHLIDLPQEDPINLRSMYLAKADIDNNTKNLDNHVIELTKKIKYSREHNTKRPPLRSTKIGYVRRFMATSRYSGYLVPRALETGPQAVDKDETLKDKILALIEQTIHEAENKIESVSDVKESHRTLPAYRAGFVLSMIKKSRDILNELFNVAVKHKDEWKALEQLKIFELLVHTNVDTTNLVKQLVDIHSHSDNIITTSTHLPTESPGTETIAERSRLNIQG